MLSDTGALNDRLVDVNFAVSNLQVVLALRIRADPRFVVDRRTLCAKIR